MISRHILLVFLQLPLTQTKFHLPLLCVMNVAFKLDIFSFSTWFHLACTSHWHVYSGRQLKTNWSVLKVKMARSLKQATKAGFALRLVWLCTGSLYAVLQQSKRSFVATSMKNLDQMQSPPPHYIFFRVEILHDEIAVKWCPEINGKRVLPTSFRQQLWAKLSAAV